MAPHTAMVRRPKWYRSKGGVLGVLLLVLIAAGAATFGTINDKPLTGAPLLPGSYRGLVQGRLPDCAGDFPLPAIVKPLQGFEAPQCQAHLRSDRPPAEVVAAIRTTLEQAGWTVAAGESTAATTTLNVTQPQCATIVVVSAGQNQGQSEGSVGIVAFGLCTTPSPSPTSQPSS
jgi:hypothetical protein